MFRTKRAYICGMLMGITPWAILARLFELGLTAQIVGSVIQLMGIVVMVLARPIMTK